MALRPAGMNTEQTPTTKESNKEVNQRLQSLNAAMRWLPTTFLRMWERPDSRNPGRNLVICSVKKDVKVPSSAHKTPQDVAKSIIDAFRNTGVYAPFNRILKNGQTQQIELIAVSQWNDNLVFRIPDVEPARIRAQQVREIPEPRIVATATTSDEDNADAEVIDTEGFGEF